MTSDSNLVRVKKFEIGRRYFHRDWGWQTLLELEDDGQRARIGGEDDGNVIINYHVPCEVLRELNRDPFNSREEE